MKKLSTLLVLILLFCLVSCSTVETWQEGEEYKNNLTETKDLPTSVLSKLASKQDKKMAIAAMEALGKRGSEADAAVSQLFQLLQKKDKPLEIKLAAARSLGKITPRGREILEKCLNSDNEEIKELAAYGLDKVWSKYKVLEIILAKYIRGLNLVYSASYSHIAPGVNRGSVSSLQQREDYIVGRTYGLEADAKNTAGEYFVMGDYKREMELADIKQRKAELLSGKEKNELPLGLGKIKGLPQNAAPGLVKIIEDESLEDIHFRLWGFGEWGYIFLTEQIKTRIENVSEERTVIYHDGTKYTTRTEKVNRQVVTNEPEKQNLRYNAAITLIDIGIAPEVREECVGKLRRIMEKLDPTRQALKNYIAMALVKSGEKDLVPYLGELLVSDSPYNAFSLSILPNWNEMILDALAPLCPDVYTAIIEFLEYYEKNQMYKGNDFLKKSPVVIYPPFMAIAETKDKRYIPILQRLMEKEEAPSVQIRLQKTIQDIQD